MRYRGFVFACTNTTDQRMLSRCFINNTLSHLAMIFLWPHWQLKAARTDHETLRISSAARSRRLTEVRPRASARRGAAGAHQEGGASWLWRKLRLAASFGSIASFGFGASFGLQRASAPLRASACRLAGGFGLDWIRRSSAQRERLQLA